MKSSMTREARNERLYIWAYLLISITGGLCAEGYVQAFMLERGLSTSMIGLFGAAGQVAALLAYALYPKLQKPKGEHHFLCSVFALFSLYPLMYAAAGLPSSPAAILILMICGTVLFNGAGGLKATSEFTILPSLYPRGQYSRVIGLGGMIGCSVALGMSLLGSVVSGGQAVYTVFFLCGAATAILGAFLSRLYRPDGSQAASCGGMRIGEMLRKLRTRRYALLFLPHMIRGCANGGMYYLLAITLPHVNVMASLLVPVTVGGGLIANWTFISLSRRVSSRRLILSANVLCALFMIILPFVHVPWLYLTVYALYYICNILSQNIVPTGVLCSTSQEDLPFVSSIRMLCFASASALTILLLSNVADTLPVYAVPIGAGIIFIMAAILFSRQFTDQYK